MFSQAFADTTAGIELDPSHSTTTPEGAPEVTSSLMSFLPLIIIFIIFYFLIIRPQQKKIKEHQKMINSIKRGDKIATTGGIIGNVIKVDTAKSILTVEIADNVQIKVLRSSVAEIMNRSQPANDE